MSVVVDVPSPSAADDAAIHGFTVGRHRIQVVTPNPRDPRLHLSLVTITLFVLGIGWLDFRLSIPQILAAALTAGAIEVTTTLRRSSQLMWPASSLQTASSIALLLRVSSTERGDLWAFDGWYYFAGIVALALIIKRTIRYHGHHVFNPSNIVLVIAFVVLGSDRIEPLDLWWVPFGPAMAIAYAVIIAGGLLISRRLGLLSMGVAFWATLALGMGVLAVLDHSITAQWSLGPVSGGHFWWIVMTSPEILIYMFFMLTDPKTVPTGRSARIAFGVLVGVAASVLAAPWTTEFGTKVGLLAGLALISAIRPALDRLLPEPSTPLDDPRRFAARLSGRGTDGTPGTRWGGVLRIAGAIVVFIAAVAIAGSPARQADSAVVLPRDLVPAIDPASLPVVEIDDNVYKLDDHLGTQEGAQDLAATLAWNLSVEHEALRTRNAELLPAVDHGYRLDQHQQLLAEAGPDGSVVASTYEFDSARLMIAYPGGAQAGANAGLVVFGTVSDIEYEPDGTETSRVDRPLAITFTLRKDPAGNWQITDTLAVPR